MTATDPTLHWAREVYKLLVNTDEGFSVADISTKLRLPERTAREAVSICRLLAARNSSPVHGRRIIGFDPAMNSYADAKSREQSERIMLHLHSRARELLEQLEAMSLAHIDASGSRRRSEKACRSCGAPIWWITTPAGKKMPVNADGSTHFGNCPQSKEWSGRGSQREASDG